MANPYPLVLPDELDSQVADLAARAHLSRADIMRQAIIVGLPSVAERLCPAKEDAWRPLPYTPEELASIAAAEKDWAELDALMAAQAKHLKPEDA